MGQGTGSRRQEAGGGRQEANACRTVFCLLPSAFCLLLLVFVFGTVDGGRWTVSTAWAEAVADEPTDDPFRDTVYLANGNEMVGIVEEESNGEVWLKVPGGRLRLRREQIVRVELTPPEVKAQLAAQQVARRKPEDSASSEAPPPAPHEGIPTETPLDVFDKPPSWLARIREAFSNFVNRVIARLGPKSASSQESASR